MLRTGNTDGAWTIWCQIAETFFLQRHANGELEEQASQQDNSVPPPAEEAQAERQK